MKKKKKITNILKDILRIIAVNQSSAGALCPAPLTNNYVSIPSPLQIPETSRQQNQIPPLRINPSTTTSGSWESHPAQHQGLLLPSCTSGSSSAAHTPALGEKQRGSPETAMSQQKLKLGKSSFSSALENLPAAVEIYSREINVGASALVQIPVFYWNLFLP